MNHMAEVAKMIGVELDKVFRIKGFNWDHVLKIDGLYSERHETREDILLRKLQTGELEIEWIPQDGEEVWKLDEDGMIRKCEYRKLSRWDVLVFKNGLIKRTREECVARRDALGWMSE